MKITVKNIEKNYPQIRHKLSDKLRTMYNNDILPALKFYGKNADVTRIIDKFIATVNKEIEYSPEKNKIADEKARQKAAKEAEKEAEKKAKAEQKAAEKLAKNKEKARIKAEKEAQKKEAEVAKNNIMAGNVPHLKSEIAFFKKYIKLHDKECTYRDIQKFYNSVCKAIVAKDLGSKTLKDLVIKMQGKIWKFLEEQDPNTKLTFKISMKDIDTYREIANSENVLLAVLLINRYLTLQTARPTAKRTEEDILKSGNKLLADIRKAKSKNQISKKYNKVMSQIEYFLDTENYLPVEIPYGLNGLGLLGTITDELLSSSVSKIGSRSPLRSTPLKKKRITI